MEKADDHLIARLESRKQFLQKFKRRLGRLDVDRIGIKGI
jgi:hypothetical protein